MADFDEARRERDTAEAARRVRVEAERRVGILDLRGLDLDRLPQALPELKHLRTLTLGWGPSEGKYVFTPQPIKDLSLVGALPHLETLDCGATEVEDLTPLSASSSLTSLSCRGTRVTDLGPLANLAQLTHLHLSHTDVVDLGPLAQLDSLESLDFSLTKVVDLGPLAQIRNLESLHFLSTGVDDLTPLSSLERLRSIVCGATAVRDLLPLAALPAIRDIWARWCRLRDLPVQLLDHPVLQILVVDSVAMSGLPRELLSQTGDDNCLPRLRAHFADLAAGTSTLRRAKVIVLGNGRVGKTQLCRRLQGLPFDPSVPTTHGISVTNARCPLVSDSDSLSIWDFGGQDLYHGTHALFMTTRAVFLVLWSPDLEHADDTDVDGVSFRHHPLAYWLDYVRTLAAHQSPVIVVQARCDRPEDEILVPPATLAGFSPRLRICHFSAKKPRGLAALAEAMREAIEHVQELEGAATIGSGRSKVLETLERWRDRDAELPRAARRHRTLTYPQFSALCQEVGGVSSPAHLLEYLHELGVVFCRNDLFDGAIILDQSWALEAVYAVFEREKSARQITGLDGRFTRSLLELSVWKDYDRGEQRLFLSLMEATGVCFQRRAANDELGIEAEYVAPDLLPPRARVENELSGRFSEQDPCLRLEYEYEFLHSGLVRGLIASIGARARDAGVYWRDGAWAYDEVSGARLLLERRGPAADHAYGGRIVVRLHRAPRASRFIEWLRQCFTTQHARYGYGDLEPTIDELPAPLEREQERPSHDPPAPRLGPLPAAAFPARSPELYISYAWGDSTPDGQRRDRIVDDICSALARHDRNIRRDKLELEDGDRISEFMDRLITGDAIIVVLSDKYLKSTACMYELFGIYRREREAGRFLRAVVPVVLPDAKIRDALDRADYARFWQARFEAFQTKMRELGGFAGVELTREFRLISEFALHVGDVLGLLQDVIVPRDLAELEQDDFLSLRQLVDRLVER